MKSTFLAFLISLISIGQITAKEDRPNVNKKLEEAVQMEQGSLLVEKDASEFVKMSFTINQSRKIQIIDMNYSNEEVKNHVIKNVSDLEFCCKDVSKDTLYYNFIFRKF